MHLKRLNGRGVTTKMILTADNYYSQEANQKYMSVSQYKAFQKCEAAALAEVRGEYKPEQTQALLLGSFVDAYFEGADSFADWCEKHPEIYKKGGELKADFEQAYIAIKRAESDEVFMQYMQGKKQYATTKYFAGAIWKAKFDVYAPNERIVDLKYMRSMERIMGKSFVEHWGYDLQMAVYGQLEGNDLPTQLAVITKEIPADIGLIDIPRWRKQELIEEVKQNLPRILEIKRGHIKPHRCGKCAYCRATKKLTEPIDFELVGLSDEQIEMIGGIK